MINAISVINLGGYDSAIYLVGDTASNDISLANAVDSTLNGSTELIMISTRACWLRAGVAKSRVGGVKKSGAVLLMKSEKPSDAPGMLPGTTKS